jgi:hypothetical protein
VEVRNTDVKVRLRKWTMDLPDDEIYGEERGYGE